MLTLIAEKVPIVFHNGLIDLIFLYECFISSLPDKLETFVANLHEVFPSGIFDSKYIAKKVLAPSGTYLAYLFYLR